MPLLRANVRAACCLLPYCAAGHMAVRVPTARWLLLALLNGVILSGLSGLSACVAKRSQYDVPPVALPNQFLKLDSGSQLLKLNDAQLAALPISPTRPSADKAHVAKVDVNAAAHDIHAPQLSPQLEQWWLSLGSSELNQLVQTALENNPDLKIANLRVEQARLRTAQASSNRLPELSLPLERKIESPIDGLGSVPLGGKAKTQATYQGSVRADWQLDIWGEKQAEFESSQMQWWRAVFARDDAQRSLLAALASSYIEYLTLNDRIRIAQDTSVALSAMLASVQQRYDRQDATITELEQQRAAVFAVRATLPALAQQRVDVINSMHFLLGIQSHHLQLSQNGLASLQLPKIEPGVPSNLLLRRPDVRVMEARLLSADADIDIARARILPQLNLTAQYGVGSHVLAELFAPQSRLWSVVAALSANIFDGGKQRAEIDYARSVHQEMVETYMRVVYVAIREVNAALSSIQSNEQRQSLQQEAVEASLRAWQHGKAAWNAGALENSALLESERSYHRNVDELLRIKQERFRGVVNLYVALGGGITPVPALPGKGVRPQLALQQSASLLANSVAVGATVAQEVNRVAPEVQPIAAANTELASQAEEAEVNPAGKPKLKPGDADVPRALPGLTILHSKIEANQTLWVAEILQIAGREQIAQYWRSLREQYPEWMAERFVVARAVGGVVPQVATQIKPLVNKAASKKSSSVAPQVVNPTGKYLLYVGNFLSIEQGEAWCEELRNAYPACQILPSEAIGGRSTSLRMSLSLSGGANDVEISASNADEQGGASLATPAVQAEKTNTAPAAKQITSPPSQGALPETAPVTVPATAPATSPIASPIASPPAAKSKGGEHATP